VLSSRRARRVPCTRVTRNPLFESDAYRVSATRVHSATSAASRRTPFKMPEKFEISFFSPKCKSRSWHYSCTLTLSEMTPAACGCGFLAPRTPGRARFDALCLRLRDVGGAGAARVYTHALDRLLQSQGLSGRAGEGAVAAAGAAGDGGGDGAFDGVATAAAAVVDIAWEKLHTGDWKDVDVAWRELYVLGAILRVSADTEGVEGASTRTGRRQAARAKAGHGASPAAGSMTPAEALRALDMAALLGGPGFREELEGAIARAQATVTRAFNDADDDRGRVAAEGARRASKRRRREASDDEGRKTKCRGASSEQPRNGYLEGEATVGGANADDESESDAEEHWRLGGEGDNAYSDDAGNTREGGSESGIFPPGSLAAGAHPSRSPVWHLASPPSLESFYCDHMSAGDGGSGVPVLISGAMSHWPALQRWRVGHLPLVRARSGCRLWG